MGWFMARVPDGLMRVRYRPVDTTSSSNWLVLQTRVRVSHIGNEANPRKYESDFMTVFAADSRHKRKPPVGFP